MRPLSTLLIVALLPLLLLLSACETENPSPPRDYYQLNTGQVSNITSTSATFHAEIISTSSEPILEHGFVWATTKPYINLPSSYVVSLGSKSSIGAFNTTIEHPFERTIKYYSRPFVRTESKIIYGNTVSFKGNF